MIKHLGLAAGLSAILVGSIAHAVADDRIRDRLRERMRERQNSSQVWQGADASARRGQTIAYGSDPLQQLDFWRANAGQRGRVAASNAPLLVFVHGGSWSKGSKDTAGSSTKAAHYTAQGYAFASLNYRLVPAATVEQQAADVVAALKLLYDRADQLGFDRSRIVLMGHSAGAHLVALVGTDERYLRGAGLSFADLAGVIPIDGAAYDVPAQMADGPRMMNKSYLAAFGADPARQRALSPALHAAAPNVAKFMIPHVQRDDAVRQSNALAAALRAAGSQVELGSFEGKGLAGHMEINRRLGDPSYPATGAIDFWLLETFR